MAMLERGGNAYDAAVAAGFAMQVAQPHYNGPAGDVAILLYDAEADETRSICGQGPLPAAASIETFRDLDLTMVPGTGLLPAVVPGAFDAWLLLLAECGRLELAEVLAPAIEIAEKGVPVDKQMHDMLQAAIPMFTRYWTASASYYFPDGKTPPAVGETLRNPALAAVWKRIVAEAEAASTDRLGQIEAARAIWSDGFVAQAIADHCAESEVMDVSGRVHGALLTADDLSGWRARFEPVVSAEFAGNTVYKCGMWSQGAVLLQALNLVDAERIAALSPESAEFVHELAEIAKLALADRDVHYGVSGPGGKEAVELRLKRLLSPEYAQARRGLLGATASRDFRPGEVDLGALDVASWMPDYAASAERQREAGVLAAYGGGEPTIVYEEAEERRPARQAKLTLAEERNYVANSVGDTSYLCVTDREGNVVSATPSGGWLQSSPVIPNLGFALGTRGQSLWLDEDAPSRVSPGATPRTTLTPTIVRTKTGATLAVGTPGGDQQDQWQMTFLVRYLLHGMSLQEALDAPGFHTNHVLNSFFPRGSIAGSLVMERRFEPEEIEALRERGHEVSVVGDWIESRLAAVQADATGERRAAVTQRGGQAIAVAR